MPQKAMRPCRRCGVAHHNPGGYCDAHLAWARGQRTKPPEQRRFYSSAFWKRTRAIVLLEQPVCALCHAAPSTTVDHIDGDYHHNDRGNLRGLCLRCEASRTGRQHALKALEGRG